MFSCWKHEKDKHYEIFHTNWTGIEVAKDSEGLWLSIPAWSVEEPLDHVPTDKEIDRFKVRHVG